LLHRQQAVSSIRAWHRTGGTILLLLFMVLVLLATGWCSLAIYYGDSQTSWYQTILAFTFTFYGLVVAIAVWFREWRLRLLGVFVVGLLSVLTWWFSISPSNDRNWQEDVAQSAYASVDGNRVTMHNIRNFTYRSENDYTPAYETRTYDLSQLQSVDLFAIYWMGPAIAHTIISFGFGDEDYLAISIEARKEQQEGYSSIRGFFRQYELVYIVADERDVIGLRTNYRKDPPEQVYRYRLNLSKEIGKEFFLEYIKSINELHKNPRFYNTLTANCTNVIWMHAQVNPDRVPFSWKILASGYATEYLYDLQRLDTSVPFSELTQRGYVNPVAQSQGITDDFSRRIRQNPLTKEQSGFANVERAPNDN
jgi:hypothetical protein